jgi:hypothetical protein
MMLSADADIDSKVRLDGRGPEASVVYIDLRWILYGG